MNKERGSGFRRSTALVMIFSAMVQRRIERRSALLSASDGTMTPRVMDEARMEMRGKGKIIVEGVEGDMRKL